MLTVQEESNSDEPGPTILHNTITSAVIVHDHAPESHSKQALGHDRGLSLKLESQCGVQEDADAPHRI